MVGTVGATWPNITGFVYSNGAPGAAQGTEAYGISNSGQVVGEWGANWVSQSFIYSAGSYASLSNPSAINQTTATGINNSGQIVGYFRAATDTNYHGFLYSNGSYSTISAPGTAQGTATFLYGINDLSQMVGFFSGGNGAGYSFLYSGGVFTQLNTPLGGTAHGINNVGQIVGDYFDANGNSSGFVMSGDTYINIDVPGAAFTVATGINDSGQIAGYYWDGSSAHGFLATPVDPAPGPVVGAGPPGLILAGGGLLGWWQRKRKIHIPA
jgi:probable HAF family extracellular repeat protein